MFQGLILTTRGSLRNFFLKRLQTALLLACALPALASAADFDPLVTSDQLSFQDIFASALQNTPEYLETPVRENQASDYASTGGSWIAGRPSLQLNYYDDGPLDNVGLNEFEYGVQLPLWGPGQRKDTRYLGEQYGAQVDAWKMDLAWLVAGRVRGALAAVANADLGRQLQAQTVRDAEQLVEVTETLFNAGEVARLELMQAQSMLAEARADMLQAEAAVVDAELAYRVITGLDVRPAGTHTEALTTEEEITAAHPRLRYLRTNVDLALATVRQTENSSKGNPTLLIGSRREQGDRFQEPISSIGVQLNIPFGGGSFVSAQTSSARRARVNAEVAYQNALIQLQRSLHEVEHDLFVLGEEEPLRRDQADLSRQRYDMALTAFEAGETNLAQVVIAQQQAQAGDRALRMLLLEKEKLITEFNQLVGVMP